jgi:hypothetical protein
MQVLTSRSKDSQVSSGAGLDKAWSKTRNYVYKTEDLTLEQVEEVLEFLGQGRFPGTVAISLLAYFTVLNNSNDTLAKPFICSRFQSFPKTN